MKYKLSCLIIPILLVIGLFRTSAQILSPQWSFYIGGQGFDRGIKLITDLNGNVYFAGTIDRDAYVISNGINDTIQGFGFEDIIFGKLNQDGQMLWLKHIGGNGIDSPTDIMLNGNGNVYLSGIFEDTLQFETAILIPDDYIDSFIAKCDSLGNLLWLRQISGIGNQQSLAMICDNEGNIISGGFFSQTLEFPQQNSEVFQSQGEYNGFLTKWSNSGELIWTNLIPGNGNSMVKDILVNDVNKYYIIGTFSGFIDPDSLQNSIYSVGGTDVFIAKYATNGNLLWLRTGGGIYDDNAKCITLGENGKTIMIGEFKEDFKYDNTVIMSAKGGDDIYQLTFNKNGTLKHYKRVGKKKNDFVFDAWIPVGNKILMTSDLRLYEDDQNVTLANYKIEGNISNIFQISNDLNPTILSAVMTDLTTIYCCGSFHDTVAFDELTLTSKGMEDLFVIKLAAQDDSVSLLKQDMADSDDLNNTYLPVKFDKKVIIPSDFLINDDDRFTFFNYPNPFKIKTQIIYTISQTCTVQIEVSDIKGNIIKEWQFLNQPEGIYSLDLYGEELNKGIYQCKITVQGEKIFKTNVIKIICTN